MCLVFVCFCISCFLPLLWIQRTVRHKCSKSWPEPPKCITRIVILTPVCNSWWIFFNDGMKSAMWSVNACLTQLMAASFAVSSQIMAPVMFSKFCKCSPVTLPITGPRPSPLGNIQSWNKTDDIWLHVLSSMLLSVIVVCGSLGTPIQWSETI